jgi:hypothetical protein
MAFVIVALIFMLFVGLRHEVGGDWKTYLDHQYLINELPLAQALVFGDPGYYIVAWIAGQAGGGVYLTNTVCALFFMAGTAALAMRQPQPWVALFVAVPYLIIVVGMGYTRQSAAIGLVILGLVKLDQGRIWPFVGYVILGALFHKTAVVMLPIAGLVANQNRLSVAFLIFTIGSIIWISLIQGQINALWLLYATSNMQSDGGAIRLGMNAIPALLYLGLRRYISLRPTNDSLWYWMSIMSLCCLMLLPLSSTLADRISLYFLPIQLVVFSRIFSVFQSAQLRAAFAVGTLTYYALVQFVWLTQANHAAFWLPYMLMPI